MGQVIDFKTRGRLSSSTISNIISVATVRAAERIADSIPYEPEGQCERAFTTEEIKRLSDDGYEPHMAASTSHYVLMVKRR